MIIELELRGAGVETRLVDPDDFTAFKVIARGEAPALADGVAAPVVAKVEEHAWISIEALRDLAGAAATPAWEASLTSMIEFARSRDWVDDELGAIRAHVERGRGPAEPHPRD